MVTVNQVYGQILLSDTIQFPGYILHADRSKLCIRFRKEPPFFQQSLTRTVVRLLRINDGRQRLNAQKTVILHAFEKGVRLLILPDGRNRRQHGQNHKAAQQSSPIAQQSEHGKKPVGQLMPVQHFLWLDPEQMQIHKPYPHQEGHKKPTDIGVKPEGLGICILHQAAAGKQDGKDQRVRQTEPQIVIPGTVPMQHPNGDLLLFKGSVQIAVKQHHQVYQHKNACKELCP